MHWTTEEDPTQRAPLSAWRIDLQSWTPARGAPLCAWHWTTEKDPRQGKAKLLSHVWLFATPWTVAHQAPPSMEFSRQEYWSGVPFPFLGDLPDPGIEPRSPALQPDALPSEPPGNPRQGSPVTAWMGGAMEKDWPKRVLIASYKRLEKDW